MIIGILLLAGSSLRLNEVNEKQYIKINDKELFLYPLFTMFEVKELDSIVLVVKKDKLELTKEIVNKYQNKNIYNKKIYFVEGGSSRQESSFNALKFIDTIINKNEDNYVLIHDAARVLVSKEIIEENIEEVKNYDATTTYINESDSLIEVKNTQSNKDVIKSYLNRDKIKKLQTPQAFKFDIIFSAQKESKTLNNDDASLVFNKGIDVALVLGNSLNFKLTTKDDLSLLKMLIEGKDGF